MFGVCGCLDSRSAWVGRCYLVVTRAMAKGRSVQKALQGVPVPSRGLDAVELVRDECEAEGCP